MTNSMLSSFKTEELECLSTDFRLTTTISTDSRFSISSIDLLNEVKCSEYLDKITGLFKSPSRMVTASQFAKRYSFLTIAPSLYAMTMLNKGLDFSVENCHVESTFRDDSTWLPKVRLNDQIVSLPEVGGRNEWRNQVVKNIFAGNISKVWHSVSKAANIPISILWENTAIYVYWLYEKRIGGHEDFQFLLNEAPASLFGEKRNPLTRFNSPKCEIPTSDQPVRVRKTCCYYYEVSPDKKTYCSSCPRK
jgi:ferric iron reductase protein FhuF